ncbi:MULTISPECIES: amino acid ABC transporter permease [Geobacillus]|uniref:Amino acid ABC transporter permease n=5 Tax=Geobacillus TaxID=129337 RepID=A0ABY9MC91_9BACL|nr:MULTISPECIES: amino acid ABC transporter permease [Geobacillus]AKM19203.1 putative glutamine ABC transporter permease protein GlnM [Geobacillus sp. 12AMOR1]MED4876578.1 amino acid ABC transporter permease [Anoxybacillus geothermalis]STO12372.1 Inner membrane amino-acid ABC transporter permease protein yecS [[Flavobacterium] thermophilum]AEV19566.1 glutamine ABC transporter permease protein glnM [Geobacillus thermoleovorans CCB_US3_UF5]AMV11128.1 glutamine ABC transporter permease [Geobacill
MLRYSILVEHWDLYMQGFGHTIKASVLALIGSLALGTIIAIFRIAPIRPLNWIGTAYVEFIRNIPLVLIVFVFFMGLPAVGIRFDSFTAGTLGLMVYTAAFIAEAIRSGIQAVPKGQMEAARSSGLTYLQAMRYVILPQAVKIVIPPLGNQFINLVKNSSVLGVIAGLDLMYYGDLISSKTFVTFDVYIFVALFYLVLTIPLSLGVGYLERRLLKAR